MSEMAATMANGMEERRRRRGTWPWFVVNVLLFPSPAHFTLLRVKEFSLGKSLRHIAVTFLLALILLASGALQLLVPVLGRLWMLLPILSGLLLHFFPLQKEPRIYSLFQ